MKTGILKPIFFILLAVLLFFSFFDMGNTAKNNAFFKNELHPLVLTDEYPIVLLDAVSDSYTETPIHTQNVTTPDYGFDLSIYQFKTSSDLGLLFSMSNPFTKENNQEIDTYAFSFYLKIDHTKDFIKRDFIFSKDETAIIRYFTLGINQEGKFTFNDSNETLVFSEIYSITVKAYENETQIGSDFEIKTDASVEIPLSTPDKTNTINRLSTNYKNAQLNYKDADNSKLKSYNHIVIIYIIIYVVLITVIALFMFFKNQIINLFHKIFNKNKKSVTGTIE